MVEATSDKRVQGGVMDCYFEDVPLQDFEESAPQLQVQQFAAQVSFGIGGCGAGAPLHPMVQQQPPPPHKAPCTPSPWGGGHTVDSVVSYSNVQNLDTCDMNFGFSYPSANNFQAMQSGGFPAMPEPWGQGHASMPSPSLVNSAGMQIRRATSTRATSRTSTESSYTSKASPPREGSSQSGGQGHMGTSETSTESTQTAMASLSSTASMQVQGGSAYGGPIPVHNTMVGLQVGTSSPTCNIGPGIHFAAHGPPPPTQGWVEAYSDWSVDHSAQCQSEEHRHMPAPAKPPPGLVDPYSESKSPDLQAHHPSVATQQWSVDHYAQCQSEEGSHMPASAANPTNLGSKVHHIGQCTPCKFFRSRRGCKEQDRCMLCHHPHAGMTYSGMQRTMKRRSWEKRNLAQEAQRVATSLHPPMNLEDVVAV